LYLHSFPTRRSSDLVVIFTNVLNTQSIILFLHRGVTLIELVVTSCTSSIKLDKSPSFARLSALSFHIFLLCPLTLINSSLIIFRSEEHTSELQSQSN